MTAVDLHAFEIFIVRFVAICVMAGFVGVYLALGLNRIIGWVESVIARRARQVRIEKRFGKAGEP